jgi:hypothetical protein
MTKCGHMQPLCYWEAIDVTVVSSPVVGVAVCRQTVISLAIQQDLQRRFPIIWSEQLYVFCAALRLQETVLRKQGLKGALDSSFGAHWCHTDSNTPATVNMASHGR